MTSLHLAQPSVAGPSGDGLRSIGTEAQLTDLERQLVALRQLADRPCDGPAVRPNAVIDVRHHEREAELRGEGVQQVQQRHGIGTAGNRHQRDPGLPEEVGTCEMGAEVRQQRRHAVV